MASAGNERLDSWKEIAAALSPPVPEGSAEALAPGLSRLENALEEQMNELPIDTPMWTPGDAR